MTEKVVVVGGVAAGPKAASRVKRLLPQAEVTLIDEDSLISYGGCGIPYYISGDVADESSLRSTSFHVLRDTNYFENYKGVRVRIETRALSVDRKAKNVLVEDLTTGAKEHLPYDKLVLATGSAPFVLPIRGNTLDGVYTISNLHKAIEIKERIAKGKVGRAVVIGGGAIGIEMAEALTDLWGVETTLVEWQDQLLPDVVEPVLAAMVCKHMQDNGVEVLLREQAVEFEGKDGAVVAVKTPSRTIETDLVIMAVGVRARSDLAEAAGLRVSEEGGIIVNKRMQTSDPDIYAAGDCVKVENLLTGKNFYAPFGSLANKEGRIAADNIAGIPTTFHGAVGSFIMKVFDSSLGAAGMSLKTALAEGYDADFSLTAPADRAHFYPSQQIIYCMMIFDRKTRKVLGVQAYGSMGDNVSARINTAAAYLTKGADIDDFANIEMAYAPPFSSAVDTLNAAAYVAGNICDGRHRQIAIEQFSEWVENFDSEAEWVCLDVRHEKQALPFVEKFGERWLSMPDSGLRQNYTKLPKDKTLIIFCNAGSRAYEVQVFLDSVGYTNTRIVSGGFAVLQKIGVQWLP